jgi:predicted PurR-regulated permease PerM
MPDLKQSAGSSATTVARGAVTGASAILAGVTAAISTLFIGIFLAWDAERHVQGAAWIWRGAPVEERVRVLRKMGGALRAYLLTLGVQIVVMAVLWWVGLWAIGIDYALLFGVIGGLVEVVPYVGPMMGLIPPLAVAAAGGPLEVGLVLLVYGVLHVFEGYLLVPWLVNKQVHLPPPLVLVSILLFGTLFGILGILVAVPLGTVAYVWALETDLGKRRAREPIELDRGRRAA